MKVCKRNCWVWFFYFLHKLMRQLLEKHQSNNNFCAFDFFDFDDDSYFRAIAVRNKIFFFVHWWYVIASWHKLTWIWYDYLTLMSTKCKGVYLTNPSAWFNDKLFTVLAVRIWSRGSRTCTWRACRWCTRSTRIEEYSPKLKTENSSLSLQTSQHIYY